MSLFLFFFFNDTATTEIYTLSLHDALPISGIPGGGVGGSGHGARPASRTAVAFVEEPAPLRVAEPGDPGPPHGRVPQEVVVERSEEHTSELQSPCNLVCRLLLEKKKKKK